MHIIENNPTWSMLAKPIDANFSGNRIQLVFSNAPHEPAADDNKWLLNPVMR